MEDPSLVTMFGALLVAGREQVVAQIGLGFFEIGSIPLFLILAVILLIPVFFGFMIWLKAAEKEHLLEEVD